jgi:hypothetical protein
MRTLVSVGLWLVVLLAGVLLARFAQDRWLIATGGALCGADEMALLWSFMLQVLIRVVRAICTEDGSHAPRSASSASPLVSSALRVRR